MTWIAQGSNRFVQIHKWPIVISDLERRCAVLLRLDWRGVLRLWAVRVSADGMGMFPATSGI